MDDVTHEAGSGTRRHGLEEATGQNRATTLKTCRLKVGLGSLSNGGQIEEDAVHSRIAPQNGRENRAIAAADVRHCPDAGEIVSLQHSFGFSTMHAGHGLVEEFAHVRVVGKIVEDRLAIDLLEGRMARFDAVEQVAPSAVLELTPHRRQCFHRRVEQAFGQGRKDKLALLLGEDAKARQRPQKPVQRHGVRSRRLRQILGRSGAVLDMLSEAQLGGNVNRLRVPVTTEKMGQLVVEILAHGLKLWPVDRECKEEENQGETWVQSKPLRKVSENSCGWPNYTDEDYTDQWLKAVIPDALPHTEENAMSDSLATRIARIKRKLAE